VSAADVQAIIGSAVGGKAVTQVQEGGKAFDLTVRWPFALRADEAAILKIPVPVGNNTVTAGTQQSAPSTPVTAGGGGFFPTGTALSLPAATGSAANPSAVGFGPPTLPLSQFVTPAVRPDGTRSFLRPGASTIYREQGQRLIAIKFEVRGRDLAGTVAEAQAKVDPLLIPPYRTEWSGEFKQMEAAEKRMARTFLVSAAIIVVLIYLAFRSLLDTAVVIVNLLCIGVGGVWALKIADLNFNISAAVGFVSILGVSVMNSLILISSFNSLRAQGLSLEDSLRIGFRARIRPLMMTLLTAILGLLPAAFSTRIGAQSQRPLAVVVVGGMLFTIVCMVLVPVLYSFYGSRTPPATAGEMEH
jgi:cobalt-zinc-cadmium resistance protein CzcA